MIKYSTNGYVRTVVKQWMFPDGGVGVDINIGGLLPDYDVTEVSIIQYLGDELDERGVTMRMNDHIVALGQTMDALKLQFPVAKFVLMLPYVPYGRQDRIMTAGEGHSLRFFAKTINGMGFSTVAVVDPHSTVTEALINNCLVVDQFEMFGDLKPSFGDTYIVAPDQGAVKKCEAFAKKVGAAGVISCYKKRVDSEIKVRILDDIPNNAKLFVLDDICDAGGTFIQLSKAIYDYTVEKGQVVDELELCVTHGLFTKGVDELNKYYDNIYTTDSVQSDKGNAKVVAVL
jgi:ribose-phosphate pyrophosphokinase